MSYSYLITAQFVRAGVKFDEAVQEVVKDSYENYNARSLLARNPKEIKEYSFSDDLTTLKIVLQSDEKLPVPSRALRLFSVYLTNETFIGDGGYLAGKQLFKMSSAEIGGENEEIVEVEPETINGVVLLKKVNDKAAQLILENDLQKIYAFLQEE
ncbi:MAG: hypothetical protein PUJ52_01390 [Firmicutes bacterium]|nr:hypothetical protein [Bacillota bacterium]